MLVIKVELWPGGDPKKAREIGRLGLANVSNLNEDSDYVFVSANDRGEIAEGVVRSHKRSAGFWKLVQRMTAAADRGGNRIPSYLEDTVLTINERMKADTTATPLSFD